MKVIVIGATGHIGTYLVPLLVEGGHEVIAVHRGLSEPYHANASWDKVQRVIADRTKEEAEGRFGAHMADLKPDAVVDLLAYTPEENRNLAEALGRSVRAFLHCGTIWTHGIASVVPTREEENRNPFGNYGINKLQIERDLHAMAKEGFPAIIIHPGHITGPGWQFVNPQGNRNLAIFEQISRGEEIVLPNFGLETIHHVHASDVARLFAVCLEQRDRCIGESFHSVSPAALTLRGYTEAVFRWFGLEPRMRFLSWEEFERAVPKHDAAMTKEHISRSPNCSMQKAKDLLGFESQYSSLEATRESLQWLIENKRITSKARLLG